MGKKHNKTRATDKETKDMEVAIRIMMAIKPEESNDGQTKTNP